MSGLLRSSSLLCLWSVFDCVSLGQMLDLSQPHLLRSLGWTMLALGLLGLFLSLLFLIERKRREAEGDGEEIKVVVASGGRVMNLPASESRMIAAAASGDLEPDMGIDATVALSRSAPSAAPPNFSPMKLRSDGYEALAPAPST